MTAGRQIRAAAVLVGALIIGSATSAATEKGTAWTSLTLQQQQALSPLQRDWPGLDVNRRQKWLEVARHFPAMPADERQRVQARMAEWARLTPAERSQARLQFQEVRQLPVEERSAKWQAYQALPEAEKKSLAQRAKPAARTASSLEVTNKTRDGVTTTRAAPGVASSALGRATAPILVQVRPGATTTTMSTRANAPLHPVQGAPKIAATADYVDPATLLPRRAVAATSASTGVAETSSSP